MPRYGLQRVSFKFGSESDVRLLRGLPEVGAHVTYRNEPWVVSAVDGGGTLIECERPSLSSEDGKAEPAKS